MFISGVTHAHTHMHTHTLRIIGLPVHPAIWIFFFTRIFLGSIFYKYAVLGYQVQGHFRRSDIDIVISLQYECCMWDVVSQTLRILRFTGINFFLNTCTYIMHSGTMCYLSLIFLEYTYFP